MKANNYIKSERLKLLSERGSEFLGVDYPILGGAMSWLSESKLVSAISYAGGFGVIACGSLNPSELKKEIEELREDNRRLASQISDLTNNRRYHEGV